MESSVRFGLRVLGYTIHVFGIGFWRDLRFGLISKRYAHGLSNALRFKVKGLGLRYARGSKAESNLHFQL